LVRRLLIDPRLRHRSDRLRQGPKPEASQPTGKQLLGAHQRWRSSTLSNARDLLADDASGEWREPSPSTATAFNCPAVAQRADQQLLLDRLSPRRPCGERNPSSVKKPN
jgi:hypothetical protein